MCCVALCWVELYWVGLSCIGLGWVELHCIGLNWVELHWVGLACNALERHLMEMVMLNKGRRERKFYQRLWESKIGRN